MSGLDSIQRVTATKPPRLVIYGPPGVGKTSLAAEAPAPVFLQTEDGESAGLEFDAFPKAEDWGDVWQSMCSLANPQHDFRTLITDSVSSLEPLIWAETCLLNGYETIESPGWQKGYVDALTTWEKYLTGLNYLRNTFGMGIILIAHSDVVNYPNPAGSDFPRWDIAVHKKARALIERWADAILMVDYDGAVKVDKAKSTTKSTGSTMRYVHCNGSPARNAKNRYGMPDKILYNRGEAFAQLAQYFPSQTGQIIPSESELTNG